MNSHSQATVSIIIGLFNVSKYLEEKRLSCVLGQTWRNLEIILVNDGSTDNTHDICREIASNDSRIVLIDKSNGGLGSARNAGLDVASGEFIWFYDVDDEADVNLVEKNVLWMQEYATDMTVFGSWFIYPNTSHKEASHFKERLLESNEGLKNIFLDELFFVPNGNGFVWNKFYRRDFIERSGIRFGEQYIQQDELFNLKLYPYAERVYVSSELLYHYYIYDKGNSRSHYIPDRIVIYESIFDGIKNFQNKWDINDKRLEVYAYKRFYQGINTSVLYNTFHQEAPSSVKWKQQEIKRILSRPKVQSCLKYVSANNHMGLENRILLRAFQFKNYHCINCLRSIFKTLRYLKRKFS